MLVSWHLWGRGDSAGQGLQEGGQGSQGLGEAIKRPQNIDVPNGHWTRLFRSFMMAFAIAIVHIATSFALAFAILTWSLWKAIAQMRSGWQRLQYTFMVWEVVASKGKVWPHSHATFGWCPPPQENQQGHQSSMFEKLLLQHTSTVYSVVATFHDSGPTKLAL